MELESTEFTGRARLAPFFCLRFCFFRRAFSASSCSFLDKAIAAARSASSSDWLCMVDELFYYRVE